MKLSVFLSMIKTFYKSIIHCPFKLILIDNAVHRKLYLLKMIACHRNLCHIEFSPDFPYIVQYVVGNKRSAQIHEKRLCFKQK